MKPTRQRVFTYITQGSRLLVIEYADRSYAEPQIPGGTIEPGESPHQAALREAHEETGLTELKIVSLLGSFERDLQSIGRNETIKAWFFHLSTADATPECWRHAEECPHEGTGPIVLELSWVPMAALPKLGGLDNEMLPQLADSLARNSA